MENKLLYAEFDLIIDTNHDASFYRELCAYCTGITNENDDAQKYADLFYLDLGLEDDESLRGKSAEEKSPFFNYLRHVEIMEDDYVMSPSSMMLNKRYGANEDGEYAVLTEENCEEYSGVAPLSVCIFFDLEPTAKQIQTIKDRTQKFFTDIWPKLSEDKVEVEGFRLITRTHYGQEIEL